MGLTENLARFTVETTYASLPNDVVEEAKNFLYETVAACLLGSGASLGKTIAEVLEKGEESPDAVLIGTAKKRSLRSAAFYNTAIVDCTDSVGGSFHAIVHPGKNVVPAALTVASAKRRSGKDLISAIILAVECYSRLDSVMALPHAARGHYSDGTVGSIGAAIAVGKLLNLDKKYLQSAIGSAAMLAPCTIGGTSMFRSAARPLTMGQASSNAVLAVAMAQAGVAGPADILECPGGFCQALANVTGTSKITEDLGQIWESRWFYHKPIVGCRLTHAGRLGAQFLKQKHSIKADEIERVLFGVPPEPNLRVMSHHANIGPNIVDHSCSGPYLVASVLLYDDIGSGGLSDERMKDPSLHELADKIEVVADPELIKKMESSSHELSGANIEILLKDGRRYSYSMDYVKGDPFNEYRMTGDDLIANLREYAKGILTPGKVEDVVRVISKLEELDNTAKLMDLLSSEH